MRDGGGGVCKIVSGGVRLVGVALRERETESVSVYIG